MGGTQVVRMTKAVYIEQSELDWSYDCFIAVIGSRISPVIYGLHVVHPAALRGT